MRLNKFIARATGMSRRKADDMIQAGHISVNDKPAILGQSLRESDVVKLAGRVLNLPHYAYLKMNKPVGYVSSRNSQRGQKTVYDLLPSQYRNLKLVGRLDKESSGVILLTNDGDFAHDHLHPSNGKSKVYEVTLDKPLAETGIESIKRGVQLEDGTSYIELTSVDGPKLTVVLHEGRNRQIRRTFAMLGYEVTGLHRSAFGKFNVKNLSPGEFKEINP